MRTLFALLLLASSAHAQTWQCFQPGMAACSPGSLNCTCTQVQAPAPACPAGTVWNGAYCVPLYVPPPVFYPHPDHLEHH